MTRTHSVRFINPQGISFAYESGDFKFDPSIPLPVLTEDSGTENSGTPVVGSRFSETDLNPAITDDQITQIEAAMKELDYAESVEVNLKSATLRINIDLDDIVDEVDEELVKKLASQAYDKVDAILPVETYFTQQSDAKMYDLSINVYNYSSFDEEHTEDHWIYVCLTKTSASEKSVVDVLSVPRDEETAEAVMNGELPE